MLNLGMLLATMDIDGWIPMGLFWCMQPLPPGNSYRIVERLVANANIGGIGLWSHTVPVELNLGATGKRIFFGSGLGLFVRQTAVRCALLTEAHKFRTAFVERVHKGTLETMEPLHLETGAFQSLAGTYTGQLQTRFSGRIWNNGFTPQPLNTSCS
jgi:hypothetical protein